MGAKTSTPTSNSGSNLPPPVSNGHDSHQQNISSNLDTEFGILRSASQGAAGVSGIVTRSETSRDRGRARSLTNVPGNDSLSIPPLLPRTSNPMTQGFFGESPDDFNVDGSVFPFTLGRVLATHSLPAHLWSFNGFKCPVCSKLVLSDEIECHLVLCLTKPRIVYNEDVLSEDKDECVICLEDLSQGDTIARLPCLCIYHKTCIDQWFQVNRSCPEHPYD